MREEGEEGGDSGRSELKKGRENKGVGERKDVKRKKGGRKV